MTAIRSPRLLVTGGGSVPDELYAELLDKVFTRLEGFVKETMMSPSMVGNHVASVDPEIAILR